MNNDAAPISEGQIPDQLNRLTAVVQELQECTSKLTEALKLVVRPDRDDQKTATPPKGEEQFAPVAHRICVENEKIENVAGAVRYILSRLEL